jgi:hypothetical protein
MIHRLARRCFASREKMMVSSAAIAAGTDGVDLRKRRTAPRDDGLEQLIGPKALFSIAEFAELINRSGATVWRLLRLGHVEAVEVGGIQSITRAEVLRFLRHGNRKAA